MANPWGAFRNRLTPIDDVTQSQMVEALDNPGAAATQKILQLLEAHGLVRGGEITPAGDAYRGHYKRVQEAVNAPRTWTLEGGR